MNRSETHFNYFFISFNVLRSKYIYEIRYNILSEFVDYFVVCESKFDHRGNKKKQNFIWRDNFDRDKIKYYLIDKPFPINTNIWENQAIQREELLNFLDFAGSDDYIFFSDPDEIVRPELLKDFNLKKKYGIKLNEKYLLIALHPVTEEYKNLNNQVESLMSSLSTFDYKFIWICPNNDDGSFIIKDKLLKNRKTNNHVFENLSSALE